MFVAAQAHRRFQQPKRSGRRDWLSELIWPISFWSLRGLKLNTVFYKTRFHCADMLALDYPSESFDAVICVFGIFFVPDMSSAVRDLWQFVRPGGKLAITTWGPNVLEPANGAFWQSVLKVRAELHKAFNAWDRISDPESLRHMLGKGGVDPEELTTENRWHSLSSPEDWWTIVMGSGYRGTIEQLSA